MRGASRGTWALLGVIGLLTVFVVAGVVARRGSPSPSSATKTTDRRASVQGGKSIDRNRSDSFLPELPTVKDLESYRRQLQTILSDSSREGARRKPIPGMRPPALNVLWRKLEEFLRGHSEDAMALEAVAELLRSDSLDVTTREVVSESYSGLGSETALRVFLRILRGEGTPEIRRWVGRALQANAAAAPSHPFRLVDGDLAVSVREAALTAEDSDVRTGLYRSLSGLAASDDQMRSFFKGELASLLDEDRWTGDSFKKIAVELIRWSRPDADPETTAMLARFLAPGRRNSEVTAEIVHTLERCGLLASDRPLDSVLRAPLLEMIRDRMSPDRETALRALIKTGDSEVCRELPIMLENESESECVRAEVAHGLESLAAVSVLGLRRVEQVLLRVLEGGATDVTKEAALNALETVASSDILPQLKNLSLPGMLEAKLERVIKRIEARKTPR